MHNDDLLALIEDACREHRDLPTCLRHSGLNGGKAIAEQLEQGKDLATALESILSEREALLLHSQHLPQADALAFVHQQRRMHRHIREQLSPHISFAIAEVVGVMALASVLLWQQHHCDWTWLLLACPGMLIFSVYLIGLLTPERTSHSLALHRLPLLGRLRQHLNRSQTYRQLALIARWRLTETQMQQVCRIDVSQEVISTGADAEDWYLDMAAWHNEHAQRSGRQLAMLMAAAVVSIAGALVLAFAIGLITQQQEVLQHLGF